MRLRKQSFLIVLLILATITFSGWLVNSFSTANPDLYLSLKKNITLFKRIYEEITIRYVDEINPDEFIKAGIEGMTNKLDPYTTYVEKEENESLQMLTQGKYGGVGLTISKRGDFPTVEEPPFEGTPAAKAGVREGDEIIAVDKAATEKLSLSVVAERLRGKPGTPVVVQIRRPGENKTLEFRLIRDVIVIHDITYADIIQDGVGYIRLIRFSKYAADQMREAVVDLKNKGIKSLILDLRSNPGGLLEAAVEVANNFVPRDDLIVYTEGRTEQSNRKYYATEEPLVPDLPLVVLVNGSSASASEIVAGAIQDLDRGLIIGSRTYGKGLVQTLVPFSENSGLRLTTAKYYIPSGRLIQNLSHLNRDNQVFRQEDQELSADTSRKVEPKEYHTKGGRIVYGGGGIKPDIEIEMPKLSNFEIALLRQSMFFNFAVSASVKWQKPAGEVVISDDKIAEFRHYLQDKNFTFQLEGEEELQQLEKIAQTNQYGPAFTLDLEKMDQTLNQLKEKQFDHHLDFIKNSLQQEVAAKLLGTRGQVEASFDDDPVLKTAVSVLANPTEYAMKLGK